MAGKEKKTIFFCQNCGYESAKWQGQCPGCRQWNTFVEETVSARTAKSAGKSRPRAAGAEGGRVVRLSEVKTAQESRILTGYPELDRVLGGGIVDGSLVLVGGDPGIGKSTLLLQMCKELASAGRKVLYISGEESLQQIRMRADRIGRQADLSLLCETNLELVENAIEREKPELVVIDSIQTMYSEDVSSAPGSVSQVREATGAFLAIAKGMGIPVFLVGHVTKEGVVAGPRVLEHMVDTVLYFEGDSHGTYRVLRAVKNRFGSTNELGVFEMAENGLAEVKNPSDYMLNGRQPGASGSVVACTMEGTRPMLLEVQALVCKTNFGLPRRTASGTDVNRVNLLMAVLEKRLGLPLSNCDAYVNIAGGLRISEPALDLAIVLAVLSSYLDVPVSDRTIAFGEVGLSGEVRSVSQTQQRIQEGVKLGFTNCILPRVCEEQTGHVNGMGLTGISSVRQLYGLLKK